MNLILFRTYSSVIAPERPHNKASPKWNDEKKSNSHVHRHADACHLGDLGSDRMAVGFLQCLQV